MPNYAYNVLFLCTRNSARSILAEGILRRDGAGRFRAYSAGSQPKGTVHPLAIKVLDRLGYPANGYHSKSWDQFEKPGAPPLDFVITVCDSAAGDDEGLQDWCIGDGLCGSNDDVGPSRGSAAREGGSRASRCAP